MTEDIIATKEIFDESCLNLKRETFTELDLLPDACFIINRRNSIKVWNLYRILEVKENIVKFLKLCTQTGIEKTENFNIKDFLSTINSKNEYNNYYIKENMDKFYSAMSYLFRFTLNLDHSKIRKWFY